MNDPSVKQDLLLLNEEQAAALYEQGREAGGAGVNSAYSLRTYKVYDMPTGTTSLMTDQRVFLGQWKYYKIEVPSGLASNWQMDVSAANDENYDFVNLFIRKGEPPREDWWLRSINRKPGNLVTDAVNNIDIEPNEIWYIGIYGREIGLVDWIEGTNNTEKEAKGNIFDLTVTFHAP